MIVFGSNAQCRLKRNNCLGVILLIQLSHTQSRQWPAGPFPLGSWRRSDFSRIHDSLSNKLDSIPIAFISKGPRESFSGVNFRRRQFDRFQKASARTFLVFRKISVVHAEFCVSGSQAKVAFQRLEPVGVCALAALSGSLGSIYIPNTTTQPVSCQSKKLFG